MRGGGETWYLQKKNLSGKKTVRFGRRKIHAQ